MKIWVHTFRNPNVSRSTITATPPPVKGKKNMTNFSEFEDSVTNWDDMDEVEKYLKTSFSGDMCGEDPEEPIAKIDLLKLWSKNSAEFPGLSKLARSILCIPATSACSERVFSQSSRVFEERRTRLSPETLNSILVLNSTQKLQQPL